MIVRIATEAQYEIEEGLLERLDELDNRAVEAVDAGDEERFRATYDELLQLIRTEGTRIGEEDLLASQVIFPPPDVTLEEASADFVGEGLIPD
jgi:hypothetical protein